MKKPDQEPLDQPGQHKGSGSYGPEFFTPVYECIRVKKKTCTKIFNKKTKMIPDSGQKKTPELFEFWCILENEILET